MYRNRKGVFSLNCQVVCGPELKILSANVQWPGSVHDSRIFANSAIKTKVEGMEYGHLLGDSGYQLKPYLLTPFLNPQTQAQVRYNFAHSGTRMAIERCFGILKRRFACLDQKLRTNIETTIYIIVSCLVLHNFCLSHNDHWEQIEDQLVGMEILPVLADNGVGIAQLKRQHIVDNYFS